MSFHSITMGLTNWCNLSSQNAFIFHLHVLLYRFCSETHPPDIKQSQGRTTSLTHTHQNHIRMTSEFARMKQRRQSGYGRLGAGWEFRFLSIVIRWLTWLVGFSGSGDLQRTCFWRLCVFRETLKQKCKTKKCVLIDYKCVDVRTSIPSAFF